MTNIERLQTTGILRFGSPEKGFRYRRADGERVDAADLERIRVLKIPPAWVEVAVNSSANGRLQVVGKDAAGRWQYLYHQNHVKQRELRKFQRLVRFVEVLPKMRATVNRHIRQQGLGRERVMAAILRILSTCFMRPGSQVYASENGSYGVATLRSRHVKVHGDVIQFDFPGKSGIRQYRELEDKQVAKIVRALLKNGGPEVFKYRNGNYEFVDIKRRHINAYIKELMGENFSAKDFRTWAGTLICACALARVGTEVIEKHTVRNRKIVEAIKETAAVLGNTPAVCRSSYICPMVIDRFLAGKTVDQYFSTVQELIAFRGKKLHPAEEAVLKFLRNSAK
ncbi:MAG: DNA topoisomerase [Acidobacteria bacterium]|nr:MAG: DNA topoisomerase [Acidobacteriota bacterium]